jgi:hypothetical protein
MYASCPVHSDYARESCSSCIERRTRPPVRPWLTGIEKTRLESVRARLSADDGAAYDMAVDLDPDGVVRFRPATLSDQLDRIVAKWIWSQAIGDVEDVA